MKKFLSLAVVCAALAATVGCDDKKSTPTTPVKQTTTTANGAGAGAGAGGSSTTTK
jgi:hypothetical protein